MAQRVFTFTSPTGVSETIYMISKVVSVLRGKIVVKDNMITAKWRGRGYQTFLPKKFTFYVGEDYVRVITQISAGSYNEIKWEYKCYGDMLIWDDFVFTLLQMFPDIDFGLSDGKMQIVSAKFNSDGIEQNYYSSSFCTEGITGSLIGFSAGETRKSFANNFLVTVRYSNGMILEGNLSKKSKVYNRILVDMSRLSE